MAPQDQNEVSYHSSDHNYKFGESQCVQALKGANIPP